MLQSSSSQLIKTVRSLPSALQQNQVHFQGLRLLSRAAVCCSCCLYPHHEHTSRVFFLVCLSVSACKPVHSNSLTTSTDSPACVAGALTKQLSDLLLSKTCGAHVSDIDFEYTRIPQW